MSQKDKNAAQTTTDKKPVQQVGQVNKDAEKFLIDAKAFIGKGKDTPTDALAQALTLSSQAISKNEKYSEAYSFRGTVYQKLNDYQRALYDFSVAINIQKNFQKDNNSNYNQHELAKYYCK